MKPPAPVVKSLASGSVKSARLGVRMKTQSRCLTQVKSPCPQVSLISGDTTTRLTKDKVLSRHLNPVTKNLPSTWSSNRDLVGSSHLCCEDIIEGPNWAFNSIEVPIKCDENFTVKIPKQKLPNSKNLEKSKPNSNHHFVQLLKKKDSEIRASLDRNRHLEDKLIKQSEKLIILNEIQSKLNTELGNLKDEIASQNLEIEFHKSESLKLRESLEHQYAESYKKVTEMQTMNHEIMLLQEENLRLLESMRSREADLNNLNVDLKQDSEVAKLCFVDDGNTDLEKETADFLEKVSIVCKNKSLKIKALSKDKNVKINLKITARKERMDRVSHQLSFSEAFESPGIFAKTPCQTFSVKDDEDDEVFHIAPCPSGDTSQINNLYDELFQSDDANIFANPCESLNENYVMESVEAIDNCEPSKGFNDNEFADTESVDANLNSNTYRVSLGTLDRADELDIKLQELWTRLSSQTDTLEELKSEKRKFTFSVDLLEEELTESRTQHKKLVDQVNVVKKLFC